MGSPRAYFWEDPMQFGEMLDKHVDYKTCFDGASSIELHLLDTEDVKSLKTWACNRPYPLYLDHFHILRTPLSFISFLNTFRYIQIVTCKDIDRVEPIHGLINVLNFAM